MTTTGTTHIDHRPASRHGPLRALAAVGAVAVAAVGFLAAIDGDERREPPPDRPAVQVEAAERVAADRALADVAAAEHLTGLSPVSLRPVGGNGVAGEATVEHLCEPARERRHDEDIARRRLHSPDQGNRPPPRAA